MSFVSKALGYARDVVEGRIVACEYVKAACQRQLDDLERLPAKGYRFDHVRAERICAFTSALPHIKGEWAKGNRKLDLEPWQCFILTTVFGWLRPDGTRRFRTAYTEVARKNAKSTISSGVGLYLLCADGESGAEVYSAATTRDQAKIVWEDAKRMTDRTPDLKGFGVRTLAHAITAPNSGTFRAVSSEANTLDGLNIHGAIIDELHAHPKRDLWEVIETATGARSQPLIWAITTAGSNRAGICYEQRDYVSKILKGTVEDDTYFGIIYTLDEKDDWADESVWIKANPNLGVSVKIDDLRRKAAKALSQTSAQPGFLTKHLNQWINADQAWMDMRRWDACGDPSLKIEDFRGERCWIGADLASKTDLAAVGVLFERDGMRHLFRFCWAPEEAIEGARNSQYPGWQIEGRLIQTDGATTDFETIGEKIRELAKEYDVRAIGFDPWQALKLLQELQSEGLPVEEVRTVPANISEPMKQFETDVLNGKIVHEGCPLAAWQVSNVVQHVDHRDNVSPRKERPENKIDLPVAWMTAYHCWIRDGGENQHIDIDQLAFA